MKLINFKLEKNEETIIDKKNIKCIESFNKITFVIDGIKYSYDNNIFNKETDEDIVSLDLKNNICKITLKPQNMSLNLNINVIENKKIDNIISIKYKIETEENIVNIITIEYI